MILIDGSNAALQEKIAQNDWARAIYHDVVASVKPYVDRHQHDSDWMVSRLQMHWKTHYARTFVNGAVWSHGEGCALVPTVRFAGGRDWATPYAAPQLEDIRPFDEDERGLWLQNRKKPGEPWEWAPVSQTGQVIEHINARIMGLAERAAFLYWFTGDEAYAQFAAEIFWTYVNGMHHRANPETFEDHRSARIIGLATFEVIHEDIVRPLAIIFDFLRDYLIRTGKDVGVVEGVFRRWADRIIEGGNTHGNWNINQARFIVFLGLALQPNAGYEDGKGCEHYLARFTHVSSENQTALKDVIPVEYDQASGIWPEAPGYAFSVTDNILHLAHVIRNATGKDVVADYPILEKAALVAFQYLFPNGRTVGFGDTYHQVPNPATLELLIARARKDGDEKMERRLTAALKKQAALTDYRRNQTGRDALFPLAMYVGKLLDVDEEKIDLATRTFYGPPVSLAIQRNGDDVMWGLMAALSATAGGHAHQSGMALELYGQGMVLGPDMGRGSSYWQKEHGEYYRRFPAHNTVVVDGISDYDGREGCPFDLLHVDPPAEKRQVVSERVSFVDAAFDEPKTGANQRRLVSVIRTSANSGFYVDIFRSHRRDGQDKKHEYLYHNLGHRVDVMDRAGRVLGFVATNELGSAHGDLIGYDYFSDKQCVRYDGDFTAVFSVALESGSNVGMKMWMQGDHHRTIFTAMSPQARSIIHGGAPKELHGLTVPMVLVRQEAEAWHRPFVSVFEPFGKKGGATISQVRTLETSGNFVAFVVVSDRLNGWTDIVLNDTSDEKMHEVEGVRFQGTYGVVSVNADGLQSLYLGHGRMVSAKGFEIVAVEAPIAACLYRDAEGYCISCSGAVHVKTPAGSQRFEKGYEQRVRIY